MAYLNKLSYLFCITVFLFSCRKTTKALRYDKNTFPKYEEILNKFFDNGKSPYYPEQTGYYLSFAKKPEGWYVLDTKLETGKQSNFRLFWSLKDKKYSEKAKEGTKLEKEENIIQRYLDRDFNKSYDTNLFYGYATWQDDVIEVLEGQEELIDEFLYTLAVAYSYKAQKKLGFYTLGFEKQNKKVKPNAEKAKMYFQNAIKYFEKLKKQNPNFQTFLGKISLKTANEYLNTFYMLHIAGFEKEAKSFLKPSIYEDFYIAFAKNLLNSCRKNAILFTYGDVDTYTLLYLQNQMNYRKDVKIVNLTMLYANWYLSYQIKKLGKLKITEKVYQDKLLDLVLFKQGEEENDFETIAKIFNQKQHNFIVKLNNNQQFFQLTSPKIRISNKMILNYSQPYIDKSKIILLDIIASFLVQKPIYFSSTVSTDFKDLFMDNLQIEGLASNIKENKQNQVNIPFTEKLIDNFDTRGIDKKIKTKGKLNIISNYRQLFASLANAYLEEGEKEKALKIAEKSLKIFPDKYVPYDYATLFIFQTLYENNKAKTANKIITKYLFYANQALKNPEGKEKEISYFQYGTYYLLDILKDYEAGKKRYDEVAQVYKRLEFMVIENQR